MKLYLDANIYYNLWKDEFIGIVPAGFYAEKLLEEILYGEHLLVVSDFLIKLIRHNSEVFGRLLDELLAKFKELGKLEFIRFDEEIGKRASNLLKKYRGRYEVDWEDLVNLSLAEKAGASFASRDEELILLAKEEGISAGHPEQLIKL